MRRKLVFAIVCLLAFEKIKAQTGALKFDKAAFYSVMASGDLDQVNNELTVVQAAELKDKEGYEGALLMRKAGLLTKAKDKLKYFKEGRIKMETTLMADSSRTELRFLRLSIEEHAPKVVKYRADINRDKLFVEQHFKGLPQVVQKAIMDYSKTSKILKQGDL